MTDRIIIRVDENGDQLQNRGGVEVMLTLTQTQINQIKRAALQVRKLVPGDIVTNGSEEFVVTSEYVSGMLDKDGLRNDDELHLISLKDGENIIEKISSVRFLRKG